MSEKPRLDVSAPARGLFHVALKKVAGETIDFGYVPSYEYLTLFLLVITVNCRLSSKAGKLSRPLGSLQPSTCCN